MLNRLFLLAALIAAALPAATPAAAQTNVYEMAQGTATTHNVLVTNVAIQVDSSTRTITGYNRFIIELWNDDASNNLFCGFNSLVSATATAALYGRRIPARSAWTVAIPAAVPVYCISDASAGVRLVLTQLH